MSLFKKPKRNFRQRITRNDSDEENGGDKEDEKNQTNLSSSEEISIDKFTEKRVKSIKPEKNLKSDLKLQPQSNVYGSVINPSFNSSNNTENKAKLVPGTVVSTVGTLSFEEEDDGEVFKVKKSSYSRRLAKQLERERRKKSKESETTSDNPSLSSGTPTSDDVQKKKLEEQSLPQIMNGDEFEEMELDSESDDDNQESVPDPFKKILQSGNIPDAAMIHAARKRRQMAREMSDFIVLDDNENPDKNNSRLIRDDDNDRSDDEDSGGRLSFSVSAPLAKDRAREALLAISQKDNNEGTDEEADEELERWEQEQIRKGVSIPQVPVLQPENQIMPTYTYPSEGSTSLYPPDQYNCPVKQEPDTVPALPLPNDIPSYTADSYRHQIKERLDSLNQTNRAHLREKDKILDDLVTYESHCVEMEEKAPRIARAFTFYQEMRGYVTDLVECLDEKVGVINTLEQNIMQLLRQRANRLVQRRQQDIKDQSEEFPAVFKKTALSSGPDLFNREKTAAETVRARRAAEREGRRTRRRRFRESKGINIKHYEGMSSDDEEMEADIAQFNMEKERLVAEANSVFEDVMEEFSSVSYIKLRFEQWKREYPESYKNAYIGLCLPKVFTPFIRLQLLTWNPLEESGDFEETRWFESLMFYSYQEGLVLDDLRNDSDMQLIPILIERIIIPKLTDIAEHVWDPMSTSQTLRFVSLIRKLINEYPTVNGKSKKTQALLKAAVNRMRKTLDDDVFIPTYHKSILENKLLGANTFFHRQYWSCVKLLRNFLSWQGIIADQLLQELALHGLLNRYLLYAMHNSPSNKDSLEKAKMITATIPRCWFSKRDGDNTIPQLEMFCRYLNTLADAMDKNGLNGTISDKTEAKENIKEIAKMLVNIGAMNHALALVNQFSLKDLKSMVSSSKD